MKISKIFGGFSLTLLALSVVPVGNAFAVDSALPATTPYSYNSTNDTTHVKDNSGTSDFGVGFKPGSLTLDQVPNFDFGIRDLGTAGTEAFPPSNSDTTLSGFKAFPMVGATTGTTPNQKPVQNTDSGSRSLVVTDQTGSAAGWNVAVSVTKTLTLSSARLAFNVVGYTPADGSNPAVGGSAYIGTYAGGAFTPFDPPENKSGNLKVNPSGKMITADKTSTPTALILDVGDDNSAGTVKSGTLFGTKAGTDAPTVAPGSYQLDFTDPDSALLYVAPSSQRPGVFVGELTWVLSQTGIN